MRPQLIRLYFGRFPGLVALALFAGVAPHVAAMDALPPSTAEAMAQDASRRSGFAMVAVQAELHNDAVFLLDARNHRLHAFRTTFPRQASQPVQVGLVSSRDLRADLMLRGGGEEEK